MKSKNFLFFSIIIILMMSSLVSSYMPRYTHKAIWSVSTEIPIDSPTYRACMKYPELCYSGNVLVDFGVYAYVSNRAQYIILHNSIFVRALLENSKNEKEEACAVGAMTHFADLGSHTEMVPYSIKTSKLANLIIHVVAEQHLDNWVEKKYPEESSLAINYLKDYQECVPLFKRTLLGEPEYRSMSEEKIDEMFSSFIQEIMTSQTGYDTAFKSKSIFTNLISVPFIILGGWGLVMIFLLFISVALIFKIFRKKAIIRHYIGLIIFGGLFILMAYLLIALSTGTAFASFIGVIKPISNFVPIGNPQERFDRGVEITKNILTHGEVWLEGKDASGFTQLDEADRSILLFDYILITILFGLLIWFIWFLFKKNKLKVKDIFNFNL